MEIFGKETSIWMVIWWRKAIKYTFPKDLGFLFVLFYNSTRKKKNNNDAQVIAGEEKTCNKISD